MRNWDTTRFTKAIKITEEHSNYVQSIRGKKSKAGKLEEIINFYKEKNTKKRLRKNKEVKIVPVVSKSTEEENTMLHIFYKINPTINYKNKTMRACVLRLYQRLTKEKALKAAEAAISVFGQPYAPMIKDPLQLEKKLPELVAFYKRNQSNLIIEV